MVAATVDAAATAVGVHVPAKMLPACVNSPAATSLQFNHGGHHIAHSNPLSAPPISFGWCPRLLQYAWLRST